MQVFDFTPQDLEHNRTGQLSPMQRYRLGVRLRQSIGLGLLVMLGLALAATFCLFIGSRQQSAILSLIGVGITLCSAAILGGFARSWMRLNTDLQDNRAARHHGPLERVVKPLNRRVVIYLVRVDGAEFNVGKEAFKLFQHKAVYTIYRAPHSGQLLSVE
jgi:hypothetical protein